MAETSAATDRLIDRLAAGATPVRPLGPPWRRALLWLALCVPPFLAVIAFHWPDGETRALFGDGRLLVEQAAALATAVTAAIAAFSSTVPGAGRRFLLLPAAPLLVWLLAIGKGCLDAWPMDGAALAPDTDCLGPMTLLAIVPAAAMIVMLRRGAPLAPRLTLVLAALACAGAVTFGLRFFHAPDATATVLVWHVGLAALVTAAAPLAAPLLLRRA